MSNKKDNVIGTRVNDKLLEILSDYAKENNIKLSKLTRDALLFYSMLVVEHEKMGIPIIMLGRSEYATLIEHLDEKGLEKVAEATYKNSVTSTEYYKAFFQEDENLKMENLEIPLRSYLKTLKKFVFSKNGQNWFEDFRIKIDKNGVILAGVHNINVNFSIFIKLYFMKIMKYYNHVLIREDLKEDKIILYFQKINI